MTRPRRQRNMSTLATRAQHRRWLDAEAATLAPQPTDASLSTGSLHVSLPQSERCPDAGRCFVVFIRFCKGRPMLTAIAIYLLVGAAAGLMADGDRAGLEPHQLCSAAAVLHCSCRGLLVSAVKEGSPPKRGSCFRCLRSLAATGCCEPPFRGPQFGLSGWR